MADDERPAEATLADIFEGDAAPVPVASAAVGVQQIGMWVVDGVAGRSESATVFACHNRNAARIRAAIKVPVEDGESARALLLREGRLASRVPHPHVVQVRNIALDQQPPYLEMALVEGPSLEQLIADGPMEPAALVELAARLVDAVGHLHEAGVHHRDIKPGNVLMGGEGPILIDFGLAEDISEASTRLDGVQGTLGYLPPEWSPDTAVEGGAWDRYSLGVLLFELASGGAAFPLDGARSRLEQLFAVQARVREAGALDPGPGVPELLRGLVLRLTAPTPADREVDLIEVATQLEGWTPPSESFRSTETTLDDADAPRAGDSGSDPPMPGPSAQRRSRGLGWAAAVGLALGAGVIGVLSLGLDAGDGGAERGPGSMVVRLALELAPADPGLGVALSLDGEPITPSSSPPLSSGSHVLEARIGDDCGTAELPAWCGQAVDRFEVPANSRAHVLRTLHVPVAEAQRVLATVDGAAPRRARVDDGAWVDCTAQECALEAMPGAARRLTVQAGRCPDRPCAGECPAGCSEGSVELGIPFQTEDAVPVELQLAPLPATRSARASPRKAGRVTVGEFRAWLAAHESFQPGRSDAVAKADEHYLKGWDQLEPKQHPSGAPLPLGAAVDRVSPAVFAAYCQGRGGIPSVEEQVPVDPGKTELRAAGGGWKAVESSGVWKQIGEKTSQPYITARCRR